MTVTLTTKDADFILKYIRQDLERVITEQSELTDSHKKLEESFSEANFDDNLESTLAGKLVQLATSMKKIVDDEAAQYRNDLEKCVELLTCGSEVSE